MGARGRWPGFLLADVTVAVGLLAVVLLTMVGLFLTLLGSSSKSANLTAATYVAKARLAEVLREGTLDPLPADQKEGLTTAGTDTSTTFHHRVTATRLEPTSEHGLGYWVEVEVWWWSEQPESGGRPGQGRLSTKLGQFYFPEGG